MKKTRDPVSNTQKVKISNGLSSDLHTCTLAWEHPPSMHEYAQACCTNAYMYTNIQSLRRKGKEGRADQDGVVHAFNLSSWKDEAGGSL